MAPTIRSLFIVHRLEERIAEKDSLLEIERQENNATKDEVTNAQNKIMELVNESQQLQDIRKHLEDNIKRFETSFKVDTRPPTYLLIFSL
mgnify:CR=1 FL=1